MAPYPFTTLNPHLGVVEFADFYRFTIADIPGVVRGASANVGLGHQFLRHIERAPILAYVVDLSEVSCFVLVFFCRVNVLNVLPSAGRRCVC